MFNSILRLPPGTKEIEIGVDNDGFIFLSFEADDMADGDVFKWNKNYGKAIDAGRARLENKNNRSFANMSLYEYTFFSSFGSGSMFLIYFCHRDFQQFDTKEF